MERSRKGGDGMSGKSVFLTSMAAALLSLGVARGQSTPTPYGSGNTSFGVVPPSEPKGFTYGANPDYATTTTETKAPPPVGGAYSLSSWMTYPREHGCCGPTGNFGPIGTEVYLRNGVSFPIGGSFFGQVLDPGWTITGGGRSLFFDPSLETAWTIDLSLGNSYSQSGDPDRSVFVTNLRDRNTNLIVPLTQVSTTGLHRTEVGLAGGREWYLWGSGEFDGSTPNWRVGVDGGGRYGVSKLELNELRHFTDRIGGVFFSAHSDFEIPWGTCFFHAGMRTEWSYTWSDILQHQNNSDVQDISLLITIGARF